MDFIWCQTIPCDPPCEPKNCWKTSWNIKQSLSKYTYIYDNFYTFDKNFREGWTWSDGFDIPVQQERSYQKFRIVSPSDLAQHRHSSLPYDYRRLTLLYIETNHIGLNVDNKFFDRVFKVLNDKGFLNTCSKRIFL